MNGRAPLRVVVAGGGTAGWMTAAALAHTLGKVIDLTLVESDAIGTIGVGESTIPPILLFNRLLGIAETEFMRETQATFKLGIRFVNWREPGHEYFHSFGTTGKDHWSAGFQHFWLRGLREGHTAPYDDYSLELRAALAGRFAHLPDERMNYAYQLDSSLYAGFLRRKAERDGAKRIEGRIVEVQLDPVSGHIAALRLDGDRRIEGDLFVDCTGFRALLIEGALHAGFDDWTHFLPCDSAIAVQTASIQPPVPYTRATAHDAGWQWRIPLQHRQGNGIVYCSRYLDRDTALQRLYDTVEGERLTDPNFIRYTTGVRRHQWYRNCVAVGLSGGFMEPLESTSIHLVQSGLARLVTLFPEQMHSPALAHEYNRQSGIEFERIRDFLILHYHVNERPEAFWQDRRALRVPDSLAHRLEVFRREGRIPRDPDDLFTEVAWLQVMTGQGLIPERHHPLADQPTDEQLVRLLQLSREYIVRTVDAMPSHEQFIASHCAERRT